MTSIRDSYLFVKFLYIFRAISYFFLIPNKKIFIKTFNLEIIIENIFTWTMPIGHIRKLTVINVYRVGWSKIALW